MIKNIFFTLNFIMFFLFASAQSGSIQNFRFLDTHLSIEERISDLVSRFTLEEKVLQMQNDAPAIPRLGIPAYNWWSECLHGVARNGIATVFPQSIGMAATWDPDLIYKEADIISTEARAKHHENVRNSQCGIYQGLTFWSPNINIFRDPRWGRGQETYGEDPYLTGRIGVAFVKGLQGNDPNYFKVISTAKHYAVHSGPEQERHKFDAWCSERDLYETYLPAFEAVITEGKAFSVMGAYNRFWNKPCCASDLLLDEILRKKWGFMGYVVSDCGAIWDIYHGHKLQPDSIRASVLGVKAGCDLTCGDEYTGLVAAVKKGYISESLIDNSVKRLFKAKFYLGMFDPDSIVAYSRIPITQNDKEESRKLARKVAQESIVLLKNQDHILPFSNKIKKILVTGPYADKVNVLLGNYNGTPSKPVTILNGIRKRAGKKIKVNFYMGVPPPEDRIRNIILTDQDKNQLCDEAIKEAQNSDVVIFVGGISPDLEGEEMNVPVEGFCGGDRTTLDIPKDQQQILERLKKTGKPVVFILTNGSALSINWANENLSAIIESWYPGEDGGNAVADVLFGDYNPAGRLPVTFYKSVNDLPLFNDYSMKNRTYRYFTGKPLYPFGYGLSYSDFIYESVSQFQKNSDTIVLKVTIRNNSKMDGDEVIQVYSSKPVSRFEQPLKKLVAFKRAMIQKGLKENIEVPVALKNLRIYDPKRGEYFIEPGDYILQIGGSSEEIKLTEKITVNL